MDVEQPEAELPPMQEEQVEDWQFVNANYDGEAPPVLAQQV